MIMRTLGKTTWDKIKVGEVFACNTCWQIGYKTGKNKYRILAEDYTNNDCMGFFGPSFCTSYNTFSKNLYPSLWTIHMRHLYKLPKSVQKLWKEE